MKCVCGGKIKTVETRGNDYVVYRIRKCPICEKEFVTKESKIDYKEGKHMIRKIHSIRYGKVKEPKKKRSGRRLG